MDLVKKNLVSIICGVIAIVAIVALFWPIKGYYTQLQTTANSRKAVYVSLNGLLKKTRQLPVVDPFTAENKPLDQFPTAAAILKGQAVTDQVKNESASILSEAVKLNIHDPLVPGALPMGMTSQEIKFRDDYKRRVDFLTEGNRENSFPFQLMQAGFPPTDQEIQAKRAEEEAAIKQKQAFNGQGQPIHPEMIEAELAQKLPKVAEQLKLEAAKKCKVYIDPTSFDPNTAILTANPGIPPEPATIFIAQVGLWIQEDVAKSIAAANSKSENVMDAPVKRLVKIELPQTMFQPTVTAALATAAASTGATDLTGQLPKNYGASPTGRVTNSVYDVISFSLKLDVDAEQIPRVLQELSRNKFITVTNCNLQILDSSLMKGMGYFYGDKPIVQLDLQCEALLLRQWTEPLMPPRIKDGLGIGLVAPAAQ